MFPKRCYPLQDVNRKIMQAGTYFGSYKKFRVAILLIQIGVKITSYLLRALIIIGIWIATIGAYGAPAL